MYYKWILPTILFAILFQAIPSYSQSITVQDSLIEVYTLQLTSAKNDYDKASTLFHLLKLESTDSLRNHNYQEELIHLAKESENPKINNLLKLSEALSSNIRGDYSKQNEIFKLFFEEEYNDKDSLLLAGVYAAWAEAAEKMGDYQKALRQLDKADDYLLRTDHVQEALIKVNVLTLRSALLRMDGKVEKAMKEINKALDILEKYNIEDNTRQQINKANLLYTAGKIPESYKTFVKVAAYTKKQGMYENAIVANMNASFVSKTLMDIDGALKHNKEALELSKKIGHKNFEATSYLNISSNYSYQKDHKSAMQNAKNALPLTKELKNIPLLVRNYYAVGSIYSEIDKRDSSIYYLEQCLKIMDSENIDGLQFYENRVHRSLGMIYQEAGDNEKAIHHLEKYFSLVKDKADLDVGSDVHKWLSRSYKAVGELEQAFYHLSQHQLLKDSLYTTENVRKTTEIK